LNNVLKFRPIKPEKPKGPVRKRGLTWEPWAKFFAAVLAVYAYQHFWPWG
jgi:hypothetical protein